MMTHSSSKFGSEDSDQTDTNNPANSGHIHVNASPPLQGSNNNAFQHAENNGTTTPKTPPTPIQTDPNVSYVLGNAGSINNESDNDKDERISIHNYPYKVLAGDMAQRMSAVYKVEMFEKLVLGGNGKQPLDTSYNKLSVKTENIDKELKKEGWVILFLAAGTIMLVTGGTAAMYYAGGAPIISWASANSSSSAVGFVSLCTGAVSGCGWAKASRDFHRKDIKNYSIKQLLVDLDSLMLGDPKYLKLCEELDIFTLIKEYYKGNIGEKARAINEACEDNIELKNHIFEYFFDNNNSFQDYCSHEANISCQGLDIMLENVEAIKMTINKLKGNSLSLSQSNNNDQSNKDYLTDPFDKLLFLAFVRDKILVEFGLPREKGQPTTTLWDKVACSSKAALGYRQEDTCVIV